MNVGFIGKGVEKIDIAREYGNQSERSLPPSEIRSPQPRQYRSFTGRSKIAADTFCAGPFGIVPRIDAIRSIHRSARTKDSKRFLVEPHERRDNSETVGSLAHVLRSCRRQFDVPAAIPPERSGKDKTEQERCIPRNRKSARGERISTQYLRSRAMAM